MVSQTKLDCFGDNKIFTASLTLASNDMILFFVNKSSQIVANAYQVQIL